MTISDTEAARARFEKRRRRRVRMAVFVTALAVLVFVVTAVQFAHWLGSDAHAQSSVRPPSSAVQNAEPGAPTTTPDAVPGLIEQGANDSTLWRQVREGDSFRVSIPDQNAATLVQSEGDMWRSFRDGPYATISAYVMIGILGALTLFYLLRGRIRVDAGFAGVTIERFNGLERFGHWLLAVSFIVLALTGLNLMYGRELLIPLMGKDAYALMSGYGKWVHNNVAWAFMGALILVFVLWVAHNIPGWTDVKWLMKGGGLFSKNVHPDSRKFNAGQKIIFWATILGGASLSLSGIALLFPYETAMMGKTFQFLNGFGFNLPTNVTPLQELQLQTLWHGVVAVVMIAIILAHIYIGSLGMEGAFDAMGSGKVDLNWAREHHNLWVAEEEAKGRTPDTTRPAVGGHAATPAE